MRTTVIILMILVLSIYIVQAQENNVKIVSKTIGINRTYDKEIVIVNVTISDIGNLSYAEGYYSINDSGKLHLDSTSSIVSKNGTDKLTVKISRPMLTSGKPYDIVKAVVAKDGNIIFKGFYNSTKASNIENDDNNNDKKSPGFGVIISIIPIILVMYISKKRKT